jgi:hypothetical protein
MSGLSTAVRTFANTGLASIPSGLFDDCVQISDLDGCFRNSAITSIPAGLLDNCNASTLSVDNMFQDCTSLVTVPSNLLAKSNLVTAKQIFYRCDSLTSIPSDLFGTTPLTMTQTTVDLEGMFRDSGLTSVPSGLLDAIDSTNVDIELAFYSCANLTTYNLGAISGTSSNIIIGQSFNFTPFDQSSVDAILEDIHTLRNQVSGTTTIRITSGATPSGTYQANCPTPSTGQEFKFHLENDPCAEGFTTLNIQI